MTTIAEAFVTIRPDTKRFAEEARAKIAASGDQAGKDFSSNFLKATAGQVVSANLATLASTVAQLGAGAFSLASSAGAAAGSLLSLGVAAGSSGALVATLPAVYGAAGLVMGTVKLAAGGLGKALSDAASGAKNAGKELAALPPATREFANEILKLKPQLDELRKSTAKGIFPGATVGFKAILPLFPALREAINETAKTLGELAKTTGKLIGGPLGPRFVAILHNSSAVVKNLSTTIGGLITALVTSAGAAAWMADVITGDLARGMNNLTRDITSLVSGNGFTDFLQEAYGNLLSLNNIARNVGQTLISVFIGALGPGEDLLIAIEQASQRMRVFAESAEGMDGFFAFFKQSAKSARLLVRVLGNVIAAITNVGKAAVPAGDKLLESLVKVTAKFKELTAAASTQNKLRDYFLSTVPVTQEFGRLLEAVGQSLIKFASLPGNEALLRQVRVELLPAVQKLFETLAQTNILHGFVDLLTTVAQILTTISANSKGTIAVLDTMNLALQLLNDLLKLPGAPQLLAVITALAGVGAGLKLITGLATGAAKNILVLGTAWDFTSKAILGFGSSEKAILANESAIADLVAESETLLDRKKALINQPYSSPGTKKELGDIDDQLKKIGQDINGLNQKSIDIKSGTVKVDGSELEKAGQKAGSSFVKGLLTAVGAALGGAATTAALSLGLESALTIGWIAAVGVLAVLVQGTAIYLAYKFRDGIASALTKTLPSALSAIPGIIGRFFSETLPDVFLKTLQAQADVITSVLPKIFGEAIGIAMGILFLGLAELIQFIINALFDWIPAIVSTISQVAVAASNAMVNLFITLASGVLHSLTDMSVGGTNIISDFIDGIVKFFSLLQEDPVLALEYLANVVETEFTKILNTVTSIMLAVVNEVFWGLIKVGNVTLTLLSELWDIVSNIFSSIFGLIKKMMGNFNDAIKKGWDDVNAATGGKLNDLIRSIGEFGNQLFHKGVELIEGLRKGVDTATGRFILQILDIAIRIVASTLGFPTLLINAGESLIDGLIHGITNKIGAVGDAMGKVVGKISGFLPHSPAKEGPLSGRGYPLYAGQKIADSLAEGVRSQMPNVVQAMGGLTDLGNVKPGQFMTANGSMGFGNSTTNSTKNYYLTVNGDLSGNVDPIRDFRRMELLGGR